MYSAEGQAGPVLGTGAGNAGFGSVAEALRLGGAFADFLNSPAAALVDGAACGEALRALGEIQGKLSAAYAAFLHRFDAADGAHLSRIENGLCEQNGTVEVHQIARLAELGRPGPGQPAWAALMARMRRKTLIVCAAYHEYIHANPNARAA